MTAYIAKIYDAARAVPLRRRNRGRRGGRNYAALVSVLIHAFDGAAMIGYVLMQPAIDDTPHPGSADAS